MKYTGFSLLIHLFLLIAATACSDEAVIGDESSARKEGKIMLSLPPSEVVEVRSAVDMKETFIRNAYVLIFSEGRANPYVESVLQISGNGNSTSPTLILQRNSPAPGDLVYVLCNVSYQGTDSDNFTDITRDNIDEKFPLTVSEKLDFPDTGLPMMGKIDSWPASGPASPICEMHIAVAKIKVYFDFGESMTDELSFTVHNYVKEGNISYSPSGLNAVNLPDQALYIKESEKIIPKKEGDGIYNRYVSAQFYLFEYPSATFAMGKQVDEKTFSVDRPYLLFERKLKSGKIEYSRYDLYKGETYLDVSRHKCYQLTYKGLLGYDTKEMAMAASNNILYDNWEISDDWSSVIKNGPYAILTDKNAIAPTIASEITLDFELNSSDQIDVSSMTRKIMLHGDFFEETNMENIVCIDKKDLTEYTLTPIEDPNSIIRGYELPPEVLSRPLSLSIKFKQPWWNLGDKGHANNRLEFQFGYLKKEVPLYPVEAANCYLAVGSGEDFNIWLGQANGDNKQRIAPMEHVTAEVLWKDNPNLQVDLQVGNGLINVKSISSSKEVGNMVIVAKVNNLIRWSWHLWYPGVDAVMYNREKGFYGYRDNYTKTFDGQTWMDRNLGALANYPNNEGLDVQGLYYQWERKDPFPNKWMLEGVTKVIYGKDGSFFNALIDVIVQNPDSPDANLEKSIANPLQAYTNSDIWDWWSNSKNRYRNGKVWEKIYDPCPIGWRMPKERQDYTVFKGLLYDSSINGYKGEEFGYFPVGYLWLMSDSNNNCYYYFGEDKFTSFVLGARYDKKHVRCVRDR